MAKLNATPKVNVGLPTNVGVLATTAFVNQALPKVSTVKKGEILDVNKWNNLANTINAMQQAMLKVQTGQASCVTGKKNKLLSGTGLRTYKTPKIALSGFTKPPLISYGIIRLDSHKEVNLRIKVAPINITKSSFQMEFSTWADTKIYSCVVSWTAVGT